MAEEETQFRLPSGRFGRKRIAEWRANIAAANKRRCIEKADAFSDLNALNGRRVVDTGVLAREMWCSTCEFPLSFRYLIKEDIIGLGSIFHIRCSQCGITYQVRSSAYDIQNKYPRFHVNLKLALGMIDGGVGEMHLNTIFSALNIPTINHNLLKRYERIVGPVIEDTAKDSCLAALKTEKALTIANERNPCETDVENVPLVNPAPYFLTLDALDKELPASENSEESNNAVIEVLPSTSASSTHIQPSTDCHIEEPVGITASYDAGWQKKGSGRSYNSLTGQGTAFGRYSRKCIAYTTRNKSCRICNSGKDKGSHDCRLNFSGSSKAMEPHMAVEIFTKNKHFVTENVFLKTLIGDDDSSTMASLRRESNLTIEKWTDKNHAAKKLVKFLYSVPKLSTPVVEYFRNCFGCALEMNKNDAVATRNALLNIVPHSFGEHDKCGSWCTYKTDKDNFKHKYLPGGKPLVGDDLKSSISKIFQQFAGNAEKLAPCGSSQINENANMAVSHKAPKSIHYGSSSSNDFRVAAAICQINMGTVYVDTVVARLNMSPLKKQALKYRNDRDIARQRKSVRIKSAHFKKRRRALFKSRQTKTVRAENKEGISYQPNCGIDIGVDFLDEPCIRPAVGEHTKVVYFDVETTGLKRTDEIVQIAAKIDVQTYSAYIMPSRNFTASASAVTGLEIHDGKMCMNSIPVSTVSPNTAMSGFIAFLRSVGSSVVLAAHNGTRFDAPMIMRLVQQLGLLNEFVKIVAGFVDTLTVLTTKLVDRKAAKKSISQAALASDYIGPMAIEGAHNAAVDVHVLQQLLSHDRINISTSELIDNATTVENIINAETEAAKLRQNISSLEILKGSKDGVTDRTTPGISAGMISKIAKAGIRLENLQQTYSSAGIEGITILLGQNIGEKGARVTTCKRVITALAEKLKALNTP